jgi:ATP-binding cassette subfamily B protein
MTTTTLPDAGRAGLEGLPLLALLPPNLRESVEARFESVRYGFGAIIVAEGEPADGLYVLTAGRARVVKRDERGEEISLNVLRAGDSFGEMALLEGGRRTATVRASGDVEALRLERAAFDELVAAHPELRHHLELQVRHRTLHNFFREHSAFGGLPVEALRQLLDALEPVSVAAGAPVIREGEAAGPMYVVQEGRLRVYAGTNGHARDIAYLRKGDFFGARALLTGEPRSASVEAVSPTVLLRLESGPLAQLLAEQPEFRRLVQERVAQYGYRRSAAVPLDFARELLPAAARPQPEAAEPEALPEDAATPAGAAGRRARRIRRMPLVRQTDERDCGAAALATVCRHFGRRVSLARLRQLTHAETDGISLRALCRAAETLGLTARAVKVSRDRLEGMPLPAIAHWEGNHWVVVYDVDATHVRVADPALGLRRVPRAEFATRWTGYAALFDYTEAFAEAPEGRPSAAWLWPFLRPHVGVLAQALGLAALVSGLQMLLPVFTQVVVDRVLVDGDTGLLRLVVLGMLGVLGFMVASMAVQRYLLSWVAVRVDAASLDFLTRRLLALPLSYFASRRTGDIQRRLAGTRQVREFLVQHGVAGLTAAVQLVAALTLMVCYSPRLALVFLATAPLYALLMRVSARRLRPTFTDLEEAFGRYFSHQIDAIRGIATVKGMGAEDAFRRLMLDQFHGVAHRLFRADLTTMGYDGAVHVTTFLSLVLFLWAGAGEVMAGTLTIGALVAFNALIGLANGPIVTLLSLWDNAQLASVLLNRLDDVFAQEPEQGVDRSRLLPVRGLEGRIELRRLSFRYGGPDSAPILDGVSVDVPAGTRVAIVGRSGSGKSTLVKCLAGLLPPTGGSIHYDGVDLQQLDQRGLRRQMGLVLQETHLFDETIARNIALGDEEPDMERVYWAARAAAAHDFVARLPLGYETRVGESGLALSGGQRQRLAIARAVYHRPPVLILDEATSALDTESERAVKESLDQVLSGRTAFVIAHRLSTVRDADLILVLDEGRLVEQGSHDVLMARRGIYYYLVSQQLEV